MLTNKTTAAIFASFIVLTSCKKDEETAEVPVDQAPPVAVSEFSQLAGGNYWIYRKVQVDSLDNDQGASYPEDSLFIDGDTIIDGTTWYVQRNGINGMVSPWVRFLRDSADCLLERDLGVQFSSGTFDQVLQVDSNSSPAQAVIRWSVSSTTFSTSVPAGDFETYRMMGDVTMYVLPPAPVWKFAIGRKEWVRCATMSTTARAISASGMISCATMSSDRASGLGLRWAALLNWIAFACAFCLALLAYRIHWSDRTSFYFLSWNLALAAIPLLFAAAALMMSRARWTYPSLGMLIPWLLFLPNAPYILTDLMHLKVRAPIPLWYDLVMLLSFALTGLLLGFLSMMCAERVLLKVFKRPVVMAIHGAVLFLCGFGIYLGRFLRWNSWEIATRPRSFLYLVGDRVLDPTEHGKTWAVTVLIGTLLIIMYALVRGVGAGLRPRQV
jgi:uncharacterized membrane protein